MGQCPGLDHCTVVLKILPLGESAKRVCAALFNTLATFFVSEIISKLQVREQTECFEDLMFRENLC